MMTTKTSRFSGMKKLALLPIIAILFVSFSKNAAAQSETEPISKPKPIKIEKKDVAIPISEKNATDEEKEILKTFHNPSKVIHIKLDTIKPNVVTKTTSEIPPPPPPKSESVDLLPSYPGGINEFRTLVSKNFNTAVFTGQEGLMKTTIYFTIDENGDVSNFRSEGNNVKFNEEATRSVKVANEAKLWTPATKNGQNVKYVFKMPLTMMFAK